MKQKTITTLGLLLLLSSAHAEQSANVSLNLDVKHKLADVETFDRSKFATIHSTIDQDNWRDGNANNANMLEEFLEKYDVYCGRSTGGITSALRSVKEDPNRPGFADLEDLARMGRKVRESYAKDRKEYEQYEDRSNQILCTQHYLYPNGEVLKPSQWALSTTDTEDEPVGTASGEFYAHYLKEFYGKGGASGEKLPAFCEITNEPLWPFYDFTEGKPQEDLTRIFKFHATVAREIKKINPYMPVGGYCTAFPDFDTDNFDRWDKRWKHFIDIAGEDMDFWTIHLYDFPCKVLEDTGEVVKRYRKGSNVEATMDMLEQYSMMKLGEIKPLMISEYGAQTHKYTQDPYNGYSCWLKVSSENAMVLQFMARANNINYTIPYHMLRMEWAVKSGGVPSSSRLMRRENEPESLTGDYVFTDNVHFYQLWSDVNGTRVDTKSDNVDIQCDAYVDGKTAYLIVNSLSFDDTTINLNIFGTDNQPKSVTAKYHYLDGGEGGVPILEEFEVDDITAPQTLSGEGTYVFAITYDKKIKINGLNEESKYYANSYMQPIEASKTISFEIDDVESEKYGEATLRLGIGRDHGKSLTPAIKVNGKTVSVPTNYRGDDQADRLNFFGVLEIPVPYEYLTDNNDIEVVFPDAGGYVSTCTMQVYNFSDDIRSRQ